MQTKKFVKLAWLNFVERRWAALTEYRAKI